MEVDETATDQCKCREPNSTKPEACEGVDLDEAKKCLADKNECKNNVTNAIKLQIEQDC
jgi:hypothetical protein